MALHPSRVVLKRALDGDEEAPVGAGKETTAKVGPSWTGRNVAVPSRLADGVRDLARELQCAAHRRHP
jgi:hypothetical protein